MARSSQPSMVYLPSGGSMGMMGEEPPVKGALRPLGKSIHVQRLGSIVGRRGAGMSNITGENQLSHSFNHYGKGGLPGLDGGGGGMF
jgi:hypothetical protein